MIERNLFAMEWKKSITMGQVGHSQSAESSAIPFNLTMSRIYFGWFETPTLYILQKIVTLGMSGYPKIYNNSCITKMFIQKSILSIMTTFYKAN